jgi:hypothetical protein
MLDVHVQMRPAAAVALAVGVLATSSACTTPDLAATVSPTSQSPSTTARSISPSPTSPSTSATIATSGDVPQEARANTPQGAEAFTLYFGSALDKGFVELDDSELRALSLPSCKSCSGAMSAIADYRSKNQRFEGQYAHFVSATFAADVEGITKVLARSETSGGKALDATGRIVETFPPTKGNLSVHLKFDGQWRVAEMQGVA